MALPLMVPSASALAASAQTFIRWITFSRSGLPGRQFKLASWWRGALYWLGLLAAAVAAWPGLWLTAMLNALVPLAIAGSINGLHRALGDGRLGWRRCWVSFALLIGSPLVDLAVLTRRRVSWRGRSYVLNAEYSPDVQRADGSWGAPCAGEDVPGHKLSYTHNSSCSSCPSN